MIGRSGTAPAGRSRRVVVAEAEEPSNHLRAEVRRWTQPGADGHALHVRGDVAEAELGYEQPVEAEHGDRAARRAAAVPAKSGRRARRAGANTRRWPVPAERAADPRNERPTFVIRPARTTCRCCAASQSDSVTVAEHASAGISAAATTAATSDRECAAARGDRSHSPVSTARRKFLHPVGSLHENLQKPAAAEIRSTAGSGSGGSGDGPGVGVGGLGSGPGPPGDGTGAGSGPGPPGDGGGWGVSNVGTCALSSRGSPRPTPTYAADGGRSRVQDAPGDRRQHRHRRDRGADGRRATLR